MLPTSMHCNVQCKSHCGRLADIAEVILLVLPMWISEGIQELAIVRTNEKPNSPPDKIGMVEGMVERPVHASLVIVLVK